MIASQAGKTALYKFLSLMCRLSEFRKVFVIYIMDCLDPALWHPSHASVKIISPREMGENY